jgi:hypothetical protein
MLEYLGCAGGNCVWHSWQFGDFKLFAIRAPSNKYFDIISRTRVKGCDGLSAIVRENIDNTDGAGWEIKCAYDERLSVLSLYINDQGVNKTPAELVGKRIYHAVIS